LREWYELKFTSEFRSKVASEFQDFFASIMEHGYPADFQKVKPYGQKGDLKCDGYHQSLKRVYQVYAPEKMQVAATNKKIDEDYAGAVQHWKVQMGTWVFVHNQWRGIPAEVLQKLLQLPGKSGVQVLHWSEPELRNECFRLAPEIQALLLGPAPTAQTVAHVQMKDVIQVANAIAQQSAPPPEEVKAVPAGKLKSNALSDYVQGLLKLGSRKSKLVKNFFANWHDPELGDRIARAFRQKYEELRATGAVGDETFHALWKFAGGGDQKSTEHEAAVLALLAFLFEECEIFEPARPEEVSR
jgi:ABC-3C protein